MAIVKATRDMIDAARNEVDWAAIDAMTDEDIEEQVRQNPDAAPILTDARVLRRVAR